MIPFSRYTFGSMSLGRNPASVETDLAMARRAMASGVWFHSSPTYNNGFTFMVLRRAFDENRSGVPRMIVKVRDVTSELMRFEVEDSCRRLGLEALDVAQLVSMDREPGNLAAAQSAVALPADILEQTRLLQQERIPSPSA